jgi:hypothetical protein
VFGITVHPDGPAGDANMSEPIEVVEGQGLARCVLEALDRGQVPDWAALDRAYRDPLLRTASVRLHHLDLHRDFTPEDVLHGFLQQRVYPPRQARKMFAPCARGERPLRPRLRASLGNYCYDLARSPELARQWGEPQDMLANSPAPADEPLPKYEEVQQLLERQMTALRRACPLRRRPRGVAYREALLLRLRLDWAGGFDGVELRSEATGGVIALTLPLLEQLTAWTNEEQAMPLVEGGVQLEQLWQQVRALVLTAPDRQVNVDRLASLIPVSRDLWNQWICRARRTVETLLGADYARVFAVWANPGEAA